MRIFLSYASEHRDTAARLTKGLEAEQHDVFFDHDDLGAGEAFHQAIRDAVSRADLMIYLVSPESVAPGSYTLAELVVAESRWPRPSGHVLPVMVAPTPLADVPAYLLAVTLMQPRGDLVAETLMAVSRLQQKNQSRPWLWALAAAVGLAASVAAVLFVQARQKVAAELALRSEQTQRASALCLQGSHADGFAQLKQLAAATNTPPDSAPTVRSALEDCAMVWLRAARITVGEGTFSALAAPLRPVLAEGLVAGAQGPRAADLRAHLGWADHLAWRDAPSAQLDPVVQYRQALQDDSTNVYAQAMWAHWLLSRRPSDAQTAQALQLFAGALQGQRDRPFVRALQFGTLVLQQPQAAPALQMLDQMRQSGETLAAGRARLVWRYLYGDAYREQSAQRLQQALPPEQGLSTFLWLFPRPDKEDVNPQIWRLVHGLLLQGAGRGAQARAELLALQKELRSEKSTGPLIDSVDRLLARP